MIKFYRKNLKISKILMKPVITTIVLLATIMQVYATGYAQKLTLKKSNTSISTVFDEIKKQTGFDVFYLPKALNPNLKINANFNNASLQAVMDACLKNLNVNYTINDKTIVITEPKSSISTNSNNFAAIEVKGKIVDEQGLGLPGASIVIKGKTTGVSTNEKGDFSLKNVPEGSTLVISFLGFDSKEILAKPNLGTIVLIQSNSNLDEVVVQAYGTTKKRALTNSVSTISAKEIESRPISNVSAAIVGSAPGIQTSTGSGQPGAGPAIRIRGFGSINGGSDPFFVVDGAPFDGALNHINPDDIETISILKDASATALYGSRASNGVVLITTKKGKNGKSSVNVKVTQGINSRGLSDYETVNVNQYFPLAWETLRNTLLEGGATLADANLQASNSIVDVLGNNPYDVAKSQVVGTDGKINPNAKLLYADDLNWRDALRTNGVRSEYNVNYTGGNENSNFFGSLGYLKDEGYSILTDFNRFNGRVNIDTQPKKWLKLGANLYGTFQKTRVGNEDSELAENPFYIDLYLAPIYPMHKHNPDGSFILDGNGNKIFDEGPLRAFNSGRNIFAETQYNDNFTERSLFSGKSYIEVKFLKDFKFTNNFSIDLNNYRYNVFDNPIMGQGLATGGRSNRTLSTTRTININQLLNYNKTIGKHSIDVLAGHEAYQRRYDYSFGSASGQILSGSTEFKNFNTILALNSYQDNYRLESYFGRAEYAFDNKYFLSTSFRRDGSSKFSQNNRWGNFWSVGAGWTISNESFFDVKPINNLKLRSSYGLVGSDDLGGLYLYQTFYDVGYKNGNEPGIRQALVLGNDNLLWESNTNMDIALEFGLFKNRISGNVEWFNRETDNLLFSVPLPPSQGVNSQSQNVGSLKNSGFEVQLDGTLVQQKNFNWKLGLNWTTFENKIQELPNSEMVDGTKKYMVGRSRYDYWLRQFYGVDPNTGAELFLANSPTLAGAITMPDGKIVTTDGSQALLAYSGQAIPDFYGSINNTFSYKNFSLDLRFTYQVGGVALNYDYQTLMSPGNYGRNLHVDALKAWKNPGDITNVPKRVAGTTAYVSTRYLLDASYFSFRTANLSYSVPKSIAQKLNIANAKVYVTGENLFMKSDRKGFDPSQAFNGNTEYTYAPTRIISFGVNLTL